MMPVAGTIIGWSNVAAAVIDLDEVGTRLLDYHDEYMQAEINSEYPPRRPRFSKLISVDITPMDPIPGAAFVQGDFTKPEVQQKIIGYVGGKGVNEAVKSIEDLIIAGVNKPISVRIDSSELSYLIDKQKGIDVILSDMCADAFGVAKDTESSLGVIKHVFEFAGKHLRRPAGTLLYVSLVRFTIITLTSVERIKYFDDPKIFEYLQATIKPMFKHARLLHVEEPKAESRDKYYLCTGFKGRGGKAKAKTPRKNKHTVKKDEGSR
ncbi:2' O-ribose methyltransferase [Ceratobasidium sp. 395]|nr:2' O-ribose methyltransferase [Ceratobasidium sp. 395]